MYKVITHKKEYFICLSSNMNRWGLCFVVDFKPPFAGIEYNWRIEMQFLCFEIIIGKWKLN